MKTWRSKKMKVQPVLASKPRRLLPPLQRSVRWILLQRSFRRSVMKWEHQKDLQNSVTPLELLLYCPFCVKWRLFYQPMKYWLTALEYQFYLNANQRLIWTFSASCRKAAILCTDDKRSKRQNSSPCIVMCSFQP